VALAVKDHEGLAVPRTAVLHTGERAIAFARMPDGTLMPHEVTTGLVAGDDVEILAGLEAGQRVVRSAGFLIDAESNLGASMAAMPGMDHSGMDMGDDGATSDEPAMDHSSHEMDSGAEPMQMDSAGDHSGHEGMEPSGR
jgi:hypothetical protein